MKIKIKKLHPDAIIPKYSKNGDAAIDLTAITVDFEQLSDGSQIVTYGTGLAFEIPENFTGLIFPRSSISKTSLMLTNSVGVIDSGYRGEVKAKFRIDANARPVKGFTYNEGDRVMQMIIIPYPTIELEEVENLSETERGTGGFGSSGK